VRCLRGVDSKAVIFFFSLFLFFSFSPSLFSLTPAYRFVDSKGTLYNDLRWDDGRRWDVFPSLYSSAEADVAYTRFLAWQNALVATLHHLRARVPVASLSFDCFDGDRGFKHARESLRPFLHFSFFFPKKEEKNMMRLKAGGVSLFSFFETSRLGLFHDTR